MSTLPETTTEASAAVSPAPSCVLPGCKLREARESRGLRVPEVASALKFSPRQIEALEADDYHTLQGATFVRGFVRSYARYLKIPADPLLLMLDTGPQLALSGVRPPDDTGAEMPLPGERGLSAWLAGAIVLALVAATLAAWHFVSPQQGLPFSRNAADSKPTAESATVVQPSTTPTTAQTEAVVPPAALPPPSSSSTTVLTPVVPPALLAVEGRRIVFDFTDKSWLEVKDGTGKIVLSGEFAAGAHQVASGKAPFQLWVGRASVVRVRDGDREVDLKPYARDEVARLTIE